MTASNPDTAAASGRIGSTDLVGRAPVPVRGERCGLLGFKIGKERGADGSRDAAYQNAFQAVSPVRTLAGQRCLARAGLRRFPLLTIFRRRRRPGKPLLCSGSPASPQSPASSGVQVFRANYRYRCLRQAAPTGLESFMATLRQRSRPTCSRLPASASS
jgi:hypothetical protein